MLCEFKSCLLSLKGEIKMVHNEFARMHDQYLREPDWEDAPEPTLIECLEAINACSEAIEFVQENNYEWSNVYDAFRKCPFVDWIGYLIEELDIESSEELFNEVWEYCKARIPTRFTPKNKEDYVTIVAVLDNLPLKSPSEMDINYDILQILLRHINIDDICDKLWDVGVEYLKQQAYDARVEQEDYGDEE